MLIVCNWYGKTQRLNRYNYEVEFDEFKIVEKMCSMKDKTKGIIIHSLFL